MERPPFEPCRDYPRCVWETRNQAAFHDWSSALRFALARADGQRRRFRRSERKRFTVRFDGRHWIVEREDGGL